MNFLGSAEGAVLARDKAGRPLSWVEPSCLWLSHFYKAKEGTGQPGRQSMSGSGRNKEHCRVTSWNKLKPNTDGGHATCFPDASLEAVPIISLQRRCLKQK